MASEDLIIDTDDPELGGNLDAFVYLRLHHADDGRYDSQRTSRPEFRARTPYCLSDFDLTGVTLEISNSGGVASDLVGIDFQVIFCTYDGHGPEDGFQSIHSGEVQSQQVDKLASADFILPGQALLKRIGFPAFPWGGLANIYFRARVSTLWTRPVPKSQWDFSTERTVTEGHLRVA